MCYKNMIVYVHISEQCLNMGPNLGVGNLGAGNIGVGNSTQKFSL